jgi:hypothetical protein
MGESKLALLVHDSGEAKIAELDIRIRVEKNVARFEISVQNFLRILGLLEVIPIGAIVDLGSFGPAVAVVERWDRLRQNFPDKVFAYMVLGLATAPDELLEVAAVTKLHDYEDFRVLLVDYSIVVLHDVGVV